MQTSTSIIVTILRLRMHSKRFQNDTKKRRLLQILSCYFCCLLYGICWNSNFKLHGMICRFCSTPTLQPVEAIVPPLVTICPGKAADAPWLLLARPKPEPAQQKTTSMIQQYPIPTYESSRPRRRRRRRRKRLDGLSTKMLIFRPFRGEFWAGNA